jgi:hypothetical protein
MTAALLLYHLCELGVTLSLSADLSVLEWDAPAGMVSPELLELLREHKAELIDLLFSEVERAAIEWEGQPTFNIAARRVTLAGDPLLVELYRHDPAVVSLAEHLSKRGGGVLEIERVAA